MMPPRRETTSVDAAFIGTDLRVGAELSPETTPLREKGLLGWNARERPSSQS
jgi:hypothetical protein